MAFKPTFCIIILVVFLFAAGISDADDYDDEYLRTDCSRLFWVGRPVLGIDLGTSYSRVGIFNRVSVYDNGHVEIIADDQGNRAIPSWVAFTDTGTLIGEAAKNQSASNPERTIFNVKRLIGRKFDDPQVQEDVKTLPYKVVNKDGRPYIEVKIRDGETKVFSPEEISAMILQKMKFIAESYLGRDVQNAVITVPAYFNDSQRLATKIAGTIAGFDTVCVTNESSTASLDSYDLYDDLVNPDEAAASEAAIVGWSICEHGLGPSTLTLSGSSIGIETGGGIMKKLIQTHTAVPTRRSHVFSTYRDNQTTVLIKVYAGERALTRDCIELGSFELSGIPPAPRGVTQIEVSIEIDPYYMIQATAQDKATNKSISITLPKETIWLTIGFEALDKRREAVLFAVEDRDVKEKIKERNKLDAFDMMNSITDGGEFGDKKRIEDTDEGKMKEMENASRPIVKRVQENTVGSSLVIARTKSSLALYATNS